MRAGGARLTSMDTTSTPLGTQVARAIVAGDLSFARALAFGVHTWTPAEARGIVGACVYASRVFGARIDPYTILWVNTQKPPGP